MTRRERGQRELRLEGIVDELVATHVWVDLRSNRWLRWGPFFWDVPAVGGFVRRSACWSLAIGDTAKQMSYCTVLLPINDQSRKSFENLLFSLNIGACVGQGKQQLWSGLEGIDIFPEAFPRLRFLLRSRQGSLPPIGKCEGSLAQAWWLLRLCPRLPTFKASSAHRA